MQKGRDRAGRPLVPFFELYTGCFCMIMDDPRDVQGVPGQNCYISKGLAGRDHPNSVPPRDVPKLLHY